MELRSQKHLVRNNCQRRPEVVLLRQQSKDLEDNVDDWEEVGLIEDESELEEDEELENVINGTLADLKLQVECSVKAPVPFVQIHPLCPLCRGAGYLRKDVEFGHPLFGKPQECRCHKGARKDREQQQLQQLSQLDTLARFEHASFETYIVTAPGVMEGYQATFKFAMRRKGWLALIGPNGCGKTHLAVAAAKEWIETGNTVMIQPVPDLLDHLRSSFSSSSDASYSVLFDQMRVVDLLVLDDLGSQQNSPWSMEKMFQLLNYRYNTMLPTLITMNLPQYVKIDPRIASRLSDSSLVVSVTMEKANDYRPRNGSTDRI